PARTSRPAGSPAPPAPRGRARPPTTSPRRCRAARVRRGSAGASGNASCLLVSLTARHSQPRGGCGVTRSCPFGVRAVNGHRRGGVRNSRTRFTNRTWFGTRAGVREHLVVSHRPDGRPAGALVTAPRRIVTGHDEQGRSVVVADGAAPKTRSVPGSTFHDI